MRLSGSRDDCRKELSSLDPIDVSSGNAYIRYALTGKISTGGKVKLRCSGNKLPVSKTYPTKSISESVCSDEGWWTSSNIICAESCELGEVKGEGEHSVPGTFERINNPALVDGINEPTTGRVPVGAEVLLKCLGDNCQVDATGGQMTSIYNDTGRPLEKIYYKATAKCLSHNSWSTTTLKCPCDCPPLTHPRSLFGTISAPYTLVTPSNLNFMECVWTLRQPAKYRIKIKYIHVEGGSNATVHDWLAVFDELQLNFPEKPYFPIRQSKANYKALYRSTSASWIGDDYVSKEPESLRIYFRSDINKKPKGAWVEISEEE